VGLSQRTLPYDALFEAGQATTFPTSNPNRDVTQADQRA
jgi:hypothetical protein